MTAIDLVARWRKHADLFEHYGDAQQARVCRCHADELDAALRDMQDEALGLVEAARESGYSAERLRHMVAEGTIPNAGRRGSPRIRRSDLPRKPSRRVAGPGFDATASASRFLRGVAK
jgi:hypothetical protein